MPKRNTSEHSTGYAEQYADETLSDSKQSNSELDHPPDDWRQTDFAHRFTDELKAINDCAAAAAFMLLLSHCRLMSKRGRWRTLRWNETRSAGLGGQALGHPESSAEHDAHGHPDLVARCGCHQHRGLFWREVVGVFLGFSRHGKDRLRGFPKLTLDNPVDRGKRVRRDSRT